MENTRPQDGTVCMSNSQNCLYPPPQEEAESMGQVWSSPNFLLPKAHPGDRGDMEPWVEHIQSLSEGKATQQPHTVSCGCHSQIFCLFSIDFLV